MSASIKHRWIRATTKFRCPICNHADWCNYLEDVGWLCMRVESDRPTKNGGWFHKDDSIALRPFIKPAPAQEPLVDVKSLWLRWFEATDYPRLNVLASELGVTADALCALGCAWNGAAWAFPMKRADGEIVGIRLRGEDGRKWAVKGSKSGLFIPEVDVQKTLYIVEGASDVAAALSLSLYAVGRPSCLGCEEMMIALLRAQKIRRVVIISDNDSPGLKGARKLQSVLPVFNCLVTLPVKDVREFVNCGGTRTDLENIIKDIIWERAA